jgi:hypothetical protein
MTEQDYIKTGFDMYRGKCGNPVLETWLDEVYLYIDKLESAVDTSAEYDTDMNQVSIMPRIRSLAYYETLMDIIKALESTNYPECTWVAKDYTKKQLINDLHDVRISIQKFKDSGWVRDQLDMFDKLGD